MLPVYLFHFGMCLDALPTWKLCESASDNSTHKYCRITWKCKFEFGAFQHFFSSNLYWWSVNTNCDLFSFRAKVEWQNNCEFEVLTLQTHQIYSVFSVITFYTHSTIAFVFLCLSFSLFSSHSPSPSFSGAIPASYSHWIGWNKSCRKLYEDAAYEFVKCALRVLWMKTPT